MNLRIQACSDRGCRRDHNEDLLSVGGQMVRDEQMEEISVDIPQDGTYQLLVSDGMGGHEKGEAASRELLESVRDFIAEGNIGTSEAFIAALRERIGQVSAGFNARAALEGQGRGMGCTLSGVIWHKGRALLINCGDSRTYRFRNGLLTLLTTDDTERGITGCPSDEKLLLTCIGGGGICTVTVEDITDRLIDEDMLVICSDGLTDEVSEDEMEVILSNDYEPAIGMVERAKDNGGSDNVSVAVALVGEGDFAPGSADDEYDDDGRYDAWS